MSHATWADLKYPGRATDFFQRCPMPVFEPDAEGFHLGNALWLSELSRLVYRHDAPEPRPDHGTSRAAFLQEAGWSMQQFAVAPRWHIHALLLTREQPSPAAVLVFRGTEQNWRNYLIDAHMGMAGWSSRAMAHAGFQLALDSVWPTLAPALQACAGRPLFTAGHSLGAALAVLTAARTSVKAVYGFGCPRLGNRAFVQQLANTPIYRINHGIDLVTRVPPGWLGFEHAGQAIDLPPALSAHARGLAGLWSRLLTPPSPLGHHTPLHYTDQLAQLAQATAEARPGQ